ncbi:MAG: hypothetical protein UGF89_01960 [Acutalibacteraceae bacterium]|nr:hypothetical protein [Acutalibacteraceae bacterium]
MKEGLDMYCDNCHRQSPDNFVNCPYCSAPLKNNKRKKPQKFTKKKERSKPVSFKTAVIITVAVAFILAVSAVITGSITGSKPDKVIKTMVTAIETNDAKLYYSLYDEQIKAYYKENWYYGDEETFDAITKPLNESRDFYISKCGEDFSLKYKINDITYISEEALERANETLQVSFNYSRFPTKVAFLDFEIEAKGEKGTYKTVYDKLTCLQINGKWYIQTSSIDIFEDGAQEE